MEDYWDWPTSSYAESSYESLNLATHILLTSTQDVTNQNRQAQEEVEENTLDFVEEEEKEKEEEDKQ